MGQILSLVATPIITYLVTAAYNWLRPKTSTDKSVLLVSAGVSAVVTTFDALQGWVAIDTTNVIANFLAGLAATFAHQLKTKIQEPASVVNP